MEPARVAAVGVAQTIYEPFKRMTTAEMVYEAVKGALTDAGIDISEVNYIVTASVDLWDGLTASNIAVTEVVGAVMRPEVRVASDGLFAAAHAFMLVASGHHDIVLLVAHAKGSLANHFAVSNWTFDPIYQQTLGMDFLAAAGIQANAYCELHGLNRSHLAGVVVKNRLNGSRNPVVSGVSSISREDVLGSPVQAYPLSVCDCSPATDGACAVVLASKSIAGRFKRPVWIKGIGYCQDVHYLGDRTLTESEALIRAAQNAYKMAGVTKPQCEFSLAEITEPFSYQELMWMEGLGLSEKGEAWKMVESGLTMLEGKFPVNPSGGLIGGSPFIIGGLARMAEAVLQIRGEAHARQVPGASKALVHGTAGPCGQSHAVMILDIAD